MNVPKSFSCGKFVESSVVCHWINLIAEPRDDIHLGPRAHEKLSQAVVQYLL